MKGLFTGQGLSLIAVAVLCLAATGLNHYTTLSSTEYFRDASSYEAMRLANIQTTHVAQCEASKSSYVAAIQTRNLQVAVSERDEAREVAINFYQGVQELSECLELQDKYISLLTKALVDNKIALPELPAPPTPDGLSPDPNLNSSTQNFPGVEVHKIDLGT